MISGKAEFFVWQGASSFLKGGLLPSCPLQKKRATQPKGINRRFPKSAEKENADIRINGYGKIP
jgi:hypothetical protein